MQKLPLTRSLTRSTALLLCAILLFFTVIGATEELHYHLHDRSHPFCVLCELSHDLSEPPRACAVIVIRIRASVETTLETEVCAFMPPALVRLTI